MTYPRHLKNPTVYVQFGSMYISERTHYRFGEEWIGLILNLSGRNPSFDPSTMQVSNGSYTLALNNSKPVFGYDRFSDMGRFIGHATYIYWAHEDSESYKLIYYGISAGLKQITLDSCVVEIVDYSTLLEKRSPWPIATYDDYPGMDPDDLGKVINTIYGSPERVPSLAVDAGGKTTIIEDITADFVGDIEITDGSRFPSQSSFVAQIDSELVLVSSRNGNTFNVTARGYNETIEVEHDKGANIAEIQTEYVYLLSDHPMSGIENVYVDDIRQKEIADGDEDNNITKYCGAGDGSQNADGSWNSAYSGYEGKGIIVFHTLPSIYKQVNTSIEDDIRFTNDPNQDPSTLTPKYDLGEVQKVLELLEDPEGHKHQEEENTLSRTTLSASCYDPALSDEEQYQNDCEHCMCGGDPQVLPVWGFPNASKPEGTPKYFKITFEYEVVRGLWESSGQFELRFHHGYSGGSAGLFLFSSACDGVNINAPNTTTYLDRSPDLYEGDYPDDYPDPDHVEHWYPCAGGQEHTWHYFTNSCFSFYIGGGVGFDPEGYFLIRRLEIEVAYEPSKTKTNTQVGTADEDEWAQLPGGVLYRVGTVTQSGNSTADMVIGKRVSADCTGYSYTRPDQIRAHMLSNLYGLDYDSGSFGEAGTQFAGRNYNFHIVINQEVSFKALQELFFRQCRAILYWVGTKEYMKFLPLPGD